MYLLAVKGLIQKFDPINRDVRKEDNSNNLSPPVKAVMNSIEKFEKVPNRREAYTIAMQKTLANKLRISKDTSESALYDWFGCGLQGGFRQSEWCQPSGAGLLDRFAIIQGTTECLAFTLADVTLFGEGKI